MVLTPFKFKEMDCRYSLQKYRAIFADISTLIWSKSQTNLKPRQELYKYAYVLLLLKNIYIFNLNIYIFLT